MLKRHMTERLKSVAKRFCVVAVLGPRQSGKSTLAKAVFKRHEYLTLEDLDTREFAKKDPRAFLALHRNNYGIILDEIQYVPELLSYIQTIVDQDKQVGYFVLTGSQNFLINDAITQTLAGRIFIFTLLPLSLSELKSSRKIPASYFDVLIRGCYPSLYIKKAVPFEWYPSYMRTYVERDVRILKGVGNLTQFQRFTKLCAGRIGQILNLTSLGNDCGISSVTARAWLTLLEASYIVFLLYPHYKNFNKRLIKSPKLYFYDTGLACSLLGIESKKKLAMHYLRGGLFESLILSDVMKQYYNQGRQPQVYFWRDKTGHEVDCIIEQGENLIPMEIKSGSTITADFFEGLNYWNSLVKSDESQGILIYGGNAIQKRSHGNIYGWSSIPSLVGKL